MTSTDTQTSERSRWVALYVLCVGVLMIVLDITVVNVALPTVQEELDFTQSGLAWVVNAYLVAFAGTLLLAGRLGDLVGRRTVFLAGLVVFAGASVACGLSVTSEMLTIARFVQGIGGAATAAVILGMIVTMFPEPGEQARAIGVYAFVASAGGAIGLVLGGILTEAINWRWAFFVNLPVGIVTWVLARRLVERDEGIGIDQGADAPGAMLITASLMLGVYTIVGPAAQHGWTDTSVFVLGAISLLLLALFVWREEVAATPLVPLGIFRSRTITGANLVQVLSVPSMFGQFFLGALYLQQVLGYNALETGLAFVPETIIMGVLSVRYTERIVTRIGARVALIVGLLLISAALALLALLPTDGTYLIDVFPAMVLFGLGGGVAFPALVTGAMAGADPHQAGLASGLINTTAQVGGALGLAVVATLSVNRT
jgi:EmrB/QacA subfamily drug resistance transporter